MGKFHRIEMEVTYKRTIIDTVDLDDLEDAKELMLRMLKRRDKGHMDDFDMTHKVVSTRTYEKGKKIKLFNNK